MSADPFENTTTVKNILQHIISPKIVSDGNGGYVTKTDIVNVDNLLFTSKATTSGTSLVPLTTQCGSITIQSGSPINSVTVWHSRVTPNSIIFATTAGSLGFVTTVTPGNNNFEIVLSSIVSFGTISWFIASF